MLMYGLGSCQSAQDGDNWSIILLILRVPLVSYIISIRVTINSRLLMIVSNQTGTEFQDIR